MIELTNTMSGKKEEFKPLKDKTVGMYNCGPTVYNYPHIGNLRKYVFDDVLRRMLEWNGYKVNQIINITDVGHLVSDEDTGEDKIEQAARSEHKTAREVADFFTEAFYGDLETLNIEAVKDKGKKEKFPKATDHIEEQIRLIGKLETKGFTYKTSDGIYFDTSKFSGYGKLGSINTSGLREGARIEVNSEKRNPTDFALWKFSPMTGGKRQQEWESPWGIGFPGWHVECSAMSMKYLGESFDIHTGGIDHIPVHHNNEIAQSEAATGKKFVSYWLHEAFLNVDNAKMAKSAGNFYRLKDLAEQGIRPLAYRYWLLTAHYRSPVNFTWKAAKGADNAYGRLIENFLLLGKKSGTPNKEYVEKFTSYINDDLDTPKAVALIWDFLKEQSVTAKDKKATLLEFDKVLGLNLASFDVPVPEEIETLITDRETARQGRNWKKADELRQEIKKLGFEILDTEKGPVAVKDLYTG